VSSIRRRQSSRPAKCTLRPTDPLAALAGATVQVHLSLAGGGGDGDQPDWIERGKMPSGGSKRRGPDSRAPDWHGDARKKEAKDRQDKLDRGELLVAIGPYCVPCGKRFAKQSVYDAHLSGKKHLAALEKLGRAEEAMVCRLDVEAKRRKNAEAQARAEAQRTQTSYAGNALSGETEEEAARRRAAREEKLRERAMLPTPATVAAASVYADPDGEEGEEPPAPVVAPRIEPSAAEMAAAAAGQQVGFYTSGMQDAADRNNRFTSDDKVEAHRQMAITPSDWFGSGIHGGDGPAAPGVHPAYRHKVPDHLKGRYDPERGDWRCDRCASWNFQRSKECWQCKAGGRAGGATDAAADDGEGAAPAQPMPPPPPMAASSAVMFAHPKLQEENGGE